MKANVRIDVTVRWGEYFRYGDFITIGKNSKFGSRVFIHDHVVIEEDVIVESDVHIGPFTYLKTGTVIGKGTKIDSHVISSGYNFIGNNCSIRYGAVLCRNIEIGNNVFISPNVMTIYLDHEQKEGDHIVIEDDVFIGTGVVINAGVTIGKGAIIGAMSLVLRDVDPGEKVMGIVKPLEIVGGQYT